LLQDSYQGNSAQLLSLRFGFDLSQMLGCFGPNVGLIQADVEFDDALIRCGINISFDSIFVHVLILGRKWDSMSDLRYRSDRSLRSPYQLFI
jgi:hypothetical protein